MASAFVVGYSVGGMFPTYLQKDLGLPTGYVALLAADSKTEIASFDRTSKSADIVAGIDKALGEPATKPSASMSVNPVTKRGPKMHGRP